MIAGMPTAASSQAEFAKWVRSRPASDLHHYELLEGQIVCEPPAGWPHGETEAHLVERIAAFVRQRGLGRVFGSSTGLELPSGDTVEPDMSFVSKERWEAQSPKPQGFARVVPDLVVEILSPSTRARDRNQKKRIYERNGVRESWLVDPESRSVTRYVAQDQRFDQGVILGESDRLLSVVLEGFDVDVGGLLPRP